MSEDDYASTVEYKYTNTTHPDRLTNFNGKSIIYNSIGYPTNYDGKTWTWNDGKLTRIHKGSESQPGSKYEDCTFIYDGYGRRIRKRYVYDPNPAVAGDGHYYYITNYNYDESDRLVKEYITEYRDTGVTTTRELIYLYDASGIIGVSYSVNGATPATYYYRKNAQGDVTAIYDANGNRRAEYAYDAWGNCKILYGASTLIAGINPIRYRGYYFDRETGLYYLNARYYNPEWRRFISPDDTAYLDPESVNGLNLYAYCNNNPVNYADPSGHSASLVLGLIGLGIGIGVGLGVAAYTDYQDDNDINGSVGWQTYVGAAMLGGAIGFGIGYYWTIITSFLGSSFTFTLPSFEALNMGGALAIAGSTTVTVTGAQIAGGGLTVGASIMYMSYERKKAAPRIKSSSRKKAYDKAFYKGGKKPPVYHPHGKFGPHFHPNNPKFMHWHYYFTLFLLISEKWKREYE